MRILVSNDDGVYSPGIRVLADVASEYGEVRIVAPDVERSSAGHAITHSHPLSYRRTTIQGLTAYRVNGTPADSVSLGAHQWGKVDLVLSGLNIGLNLGNSIWHSGTVAAARQAVLLGLRGIALSAPAGAEPDFEPYKPWMRRVLDILLDEPSLHLVNVNLPREPRGLVWTRASVRRYDGRIVPTRHPQGRELFWFTATPVEGADEGTDRWAMERGWISLTPLRLDPTDEQPLGMMRLRHPLDESIAAAVSPPTASAAVQRTVRDDEAEHAITKTADDPAVTQPAGAAAAPRDRRSI
jgi:5'-nucleotidase